MMLHTRRRTLAALVSAMTFLGIGWVVGSGPAGAAPPSGYPVTGLDVSVFQGSINWAAVAGTGVRFAYVRASEQNGIADANFAVNYGGAKSNGLYTGAYHRARPDVSGGRAQADGFANRARYSADGRTLPLMLDIEWPRANWGQPDCYNLGAAGMVNWIRDFVNEIAVRTGRLAMIYTNTNWWNECTGGSAVFSAYPLFIANYHQSPPPLPPGWAKFTFWQYTGSGSVTGISGAVDQDVFNGDLATLTQLAGGTPSPPEIGLRARANGRFVTADGGGTEPLIASRTAIGRWEQFTLIDAGSGYVALQARSNNRYVSAENAGAAPLIADRTVISRWEKFRLIINTDGTLSLRALVNNRYVSAENAGDAPLIANRTVISRWEKFDRISRPATINLRAAANNRYVTAENAGAQPLIANRVAISRWEQFTLIDAGSGYVALRARANNKYVSAENAGAAPLIANRTVISRWEKFRLITNTDGTVSLRALVNNRYVSADDAGAAPLIANRTAIHTWEKFHRVVD